MHCTSTIVADTLLLLTITMVPATFGNLTCLLENSLKLEGVSLLCANVAIGENIQGKIKVQVVVVPLLITTKKDCL